MKVITLSKNFLAMHPKAGKPTGFEKKFLTGSKIHTLRENSKGYLKDGDIVSVRQWTGKPYVSKQRVIKDGVKISIEHINLDCCKETTIVESNGKECVQWIRDVAKNDGLSELDFKSWMFGVGGIRNKQMDIIHFTDFKYTEEE